MVTPNSGMSKERPKKKVQPKQKYPARTTACLDPFPLKEEIESLIRNKAQSSLQFPDSKKMQQGDYPYYSYPNSGHISPAPIPNPAPSPPSYASAPPFSATYTPSSDYASYPPPYTYNNPDLLSTAPPPPPLSPAPAPVVQQPQYSSPFPSFESHGPYYPTLTPTPTPNSSYPSVYPAQNYDNSTGKFDHNGAYFDEKLDNYGNYGSRRGEFGQDSYVKRAESGYGNDGYGDGDGVYAYQGSKVEPYGARGTSSKSSTWSSSFDDFGRPIGYNSPKERSSAPAAKIVKAVPKVDTQQDVKSGVQKFRVKLLAESGGQSTQDVLCQVCLLSVAKLGILLRVFETLVYITKKLFLAYIHSYVLYARYNFTLMFLESM